MFLEVGGRAPPTQPFLEISYRTINEEDHGL